MRNVPPTTFGDISSRFEKRARVLRVRLELARATFLHVEIDVERPAPGVARRRHRRRGKLYALPAFGPAACGRLHVRKLALLTHLEAGDVELHAQVCTRRIGPRLVRQERRHVEERAARLHRLARLGARGRRLAPRTELGQVDAVPSARGASVSTSRHSLPSGANSIRPRMPTPSPEKSTTSSVRSTSLRSAICRRARVGVPGSRVQSISGAASFHVGEIEIHRDVAPPVAERLRGQVHARRPDGIGCEIEAETILRCCVRPATCGRPLDDLGLVGKFAPVDDVRVRSGKTHGALHVEPAVVDADIDRAVLDRLAQNGALLGEARDLAGPPARRAGRV